MQQPCIILDKPEPPTGLGRFRYVMDRNYGGGGGRGGVLKVCDEGVFKIYDDSESPNEGACLQYTLNDDSESPNEGAFKPYDEPESPNGGRA